MVNNFPTRPETPISSSKHDREEKYMGLDLPFARWVDGMVKTFTQLTLL
jgi:hypothetical protein